MSTPPDEPDQVPAASDISSADAPAPSAQNPHADGPRADTSGDIPTENFAGSPPPYVTQPNAGGTDRTAPSHTEHSHTGPAQSAIAHLWQTRPVRPKSGRTVGGVCRGVGNRYLVDPTLVKVAFAVATFFGGAGILLYLIALIVFPSADRKSPDRATPTGYPETPAPAGRSHVRHGRPTAQMMMLIAGAVVLVWVLLADHSWSSSGVVGTALVLVGWWLLYERTPIAPAGTSADQHDTGSPPTMTVPNGSIPSTGPDGSPYPQFHAAYPAPTMHSGTPYSGTPYASSPPPADPRHDAYSGTTYPAPSSPDDATYRAYSAPAPTAPAPISPAPDPAKPPRSPITPITTGVALVVAAGGTAAHFAGADWFTAGRIASLALAVLGLGLVIGGLVRRGDRARSTGLIPIAVLTGAVAVSATALAGSTWSIPSGGVGDRTWTPTTSADLRDRYELTVGSSTLDLRDLGALNHDRRVEIRQGVGDVLVLLPRGINVEPECTANVGDVTCPARINGGGDGAPTLTIDVHVTLGSVEMKR